ncbi:MAG: serine hydrolase domain-containing protein [Steroidobacteraceae bacterium]
MSMFEHEQGERRSGFVAMQSKPGSGGWRQFIRSFDLSHLVLAILFLVVSVSPQSGGAQEATPLQGDYVGTLGPLSLKLHIKAAANGALTCTLDSPNQSAFGIPCNDLRIEGQSFSFKVPAVSGSWQGSIDDSGATLSGSWTQGAARPLVFTRDTFVAAAQPSPVDGFWLGTLQGQSDALSVQLTVTSDQAGKQYCNGDNLDQRMFNMACANVVFSGDDFSFDIPSVKGRFSGKLSADGKALAGTWTDPSYSVPLSFTRQAQRRSAAQRAPLTYLDALAPVDANGIKAVLDRDLEDTLKIGALSSENAGGVVIGVVHHGVRRVFAYGTAKTDSIFEIGSITKTFTATALAQMIQQGQVTVTMPVRELLPAGTVARPQGAEITLLDLVTQHSGLPRMPDNFNPADRDNPYADYRAAELYQFIGKYGVGKSADTGFLYSNLGFGLLGQALANRAGTDYPTLLQQKVTGPLGMKDTVIKLSAKQQSRFIEGHLANHRPAHAWDLDGMAGAGAIRSTAADMLTYLEAQLHPQGIKSATTKDANARSLPAAITQAHALQRDAGSNARIAYAWIYNSNTGDYWHNGATGGYSSYAFFNPQQDYAAVVLFNTTPNDRGSFADYLGQHISQRFGGKPAVFLGGRW